jgi:uncharacterized SAM-binding protein YcdF (DUF218 family)
MKLARRLAVGLVVAGLAYLAFTFAQVWWTARQDYAAPAQAIVVLGAAQYDGRPSDVLHARLDHTLGLWRRGLAPVIVVTGGRQPGDRFTEATASAEYLLSQGVPDSKVLREVSGHSSWQSLAAVAGFLDDRGINDVLLVSDPFHSYRIRAIASELGMRGLPSPTRTSPIRGSAVVPHLLRETLAVAAGHITGFERQARIQSDLDKAVRTGV